MKLLNQAMSWLLSKVNTCQMKRSFISMLAVLLITSPAHADPIKESTIEYKIKAALIYKLAKFVKWPQQAFKQSNSPLHICLLGDNRFGDVLGVLEQRKVGDHPIAVKYHPSWMSEIKYTCHILFVSSIPPALLNEVLTSLKYLPILTISDIENFAEHRGMIQLANNGLRIGFRINLDSAKLAGLNIAAPLLGMSTLVQTMQPEASY